MGVKYQLKKYENWIIALAALAALVLFTGFKFDYFYDLNDDVLMKDILAGVYTGTPEGHNIQMLWPVSAFISLFYRAAGDIPWYGLFLCICHYGMFFLIVKRESWICRDAAGQTSGSVCGEHAFYRAVSGASGVCPVHGNMHFAWGRSGLLVLYHGHGTWAEEIYP